MSLEFDIHNLLLLKVEPAAIGSQLLAQIEADLKSFSQRDLNSFYLFLLKSGQAPLLIKFALSHIDDEGFEMPWAYFLDALALYQEILDDKIKTALIEGLEETQGYNRAALSAQAQNLFTDAPKWREEFDYEVRNQQLNLKKSVLDDLQTFRTQQLYEEERNLIRKMQRMFPEDREILKEVLEYKKRSALDVLQKKGPRKKIELEDLPPPLDPELKEPLQALGQSLIEAVQKDPSLSLDLAVVAYLLEDYESSLAIIDMGEAAPSLLWFKLEALLKARRFVELLNALTQIELMFSHDGETFFATAYLRAQALWGLGQKHAAIEVMEGLLASRPHYRAGSALLSMWSLK